MLLKSPDANTHTHTPCVNNYNANKLNINDYEAQRRDLGCFSIDMNLFMSSGVFKVYYTYSRISFPLKHC